MKIIVKIVLNNIKMLVEWNKEMEVMLATQKIWISWINLILDKIKQHPYKIRGSHYYKKLTLGPRQL